MDSPYSVVGEEVVPWKEFCVKSSRRRDTSGHAVIS